MHYIRSSVLAFACVAVLGCSAAETPKAEFKKVLPSDPSITNERIAEHTVFYKKAGNLMKYVMRKASYGGKEVYKLEVFFNPTPDALPDTIYLDPDSLAFVGRHLALSAYTIKVSFDNGIFSGSLTPSEESEYAAVEYNKTYEHEAFEPAVINYAMSVLPLEQGYRASIPVFDLNNGSQLFWSNIEVIGREKVTLGDRVFDTWKVNSRGIRNKTIWVSVNKPYAIKMETEGNVGAWEIDTSQLQKH